MGVGALCYVSMAMIAPHVTMGGMFINMFSDLEHAELIVVWGANPATDCPPLDYKRIMEATQRGAELVVIDPRRTLTAKIAAPGGFPSGPARTAPWPWPCARSSLRKSCTTNPSSGIGPLGSKSLLNMSNTFARRWLSP
jgi:hypothetical protein